LKAGDVTSPIVVTGASGFVGRSLVRHLARRGLSTVALSRHTKGAFASTTVRSEVVTAYADFVPQAGSVLIHLAEPPHITSVDARGQAHIEQMQEQASALLARNYRRVIYASSATVYGDASDRPWTAERRLAESPKVYAQSKLAVEELFLAAEGTVARVTNLYGPGMAKTTIFADILAQLGGEGPVVIREETPVRDYLWIDDATSAFAAMALGDHGGIYNVASGSAISCGDLAVLILRLAGEPDRPVLAKLPARPSVLRIDIEKTKHDFQWIPEVELETGIRKLLEPETQ
jgi:nucleoside-diphosphate-sugar epimerase